MEKLLEFGLKRVCYWAVALIVLLLVLPLQNPTKSFIDAFGGRLWNRINRSKNGSTTNESVQDVLLGRRTINNFEDALPDHWEIALKEAIHAATYAPNHKRTEPWRFHLLGPESIKRVSDLNAKLVVAEKGPEAGEKKLKRWLAIPGWLVVTCQCSPSNNSGDSSGSSGTILDPMSLAREDYAACCCAVQNLCLSLHANGLGTKWTTGLVNFDKKFADVVGFYPEEEYVVGTIWFGTPASEPTVPAKKLTVDDVLVRHQ